MERTEALAEGFVLAASPAGGERVAQPPVRQSAGWRGRLAVVALVGLSVSGYLLAISAIDAVAHGDLSKLF